MTVSVAPINRGLLEKETHSVSESGCFLVLLTSSEHQTHRASGLQLLSGHTVKKHIKGGREDRKKDSFSLCLCVNGHILKVRANKVELCCAEVSDSDVLSL